LPFERHAQLNDVRLAIVDNSAWVLTSDGVFRSNGNSEETGAARSVVGNFSEFGRLNDERSLTTNAVSAMYVDSRHSLWVGSFRNGIDVFSPDGKRLSHLESDTLREINSLSESSNGGSIVAATGDGILRIDPGLRQVGELSTGDGLLSNSVMRYVESRADNGSTGDQKGQFVQVACATGKGLSFGDPRRLRGLTTLQGLPSNSLYTALFYGRDLYVGTLGGLALIEDGRVKRVFDSSNSALTNNWVTALSVAGSRIFIGTYGAGIFELMPSNEIVRLPESGQSIVNPNAMWTDGKELYVGTLDGGLGWNLDSQTWTHYHNELPSQAVLSVTGDDRYVYFGTTSGISQIERSYRPKS
jgi:ligand-binding sensor domain-containing protein